MADEITVTTGMRLANGELVSEVKTTNISMDQTTARGGGPGTQDIPTSETTIDFGDIVPGYVHLKNLDTINFVNWGNVTLNLDQKVSPGMTAIFEMESAGVLILQADTATCKVQITAFNS